MRYCSKKILLCFPTGTFVRALVVFGPLKLSFPSPIVPCGFSCPCRPYYLQDLTEFDFNQTNTVGLLVRETIGGEYYTGPDNYLLNMTEGEVQQWNLEGSEQHPFHVHVNHVQYVNVDGPSLVPGWNHVGDWVDTVSSEYSRALWSVDEVTTRAQKKSHLRAIYNRSCMCWLLEQNHSEQFAACDGYSLDLLICLVFAYRVFSRKSDVWFIVGLDGVVFVSLCLKCVTQSGTQAATE